MKENKNSTNIQIFFPKLNKNKLKRKRSKTRILEDEDEYTSYIIIYCKYDSSKSCDFNESFISNNGILYNINKSSNSSKLQTIRMEMRFSTPLTDCNHLIRKAIINIDLITNISVSNFDT